MASELPRKAGPIVVEDSRAVPPLWIPLNRSQTTLFPTPLQTNSPPYLDSPVGPQMGKHRQKQAAQYGLPVYPHQEASPRRARSNSDLGHGTSDTPDQTVASDEKQLLFRKQSSRYPKATRSRWVSFVLYLIFAVITVALAVDIHQRSTSLLRDDGRFRSPKFRRGLPPEENVRLAFWRAMPFVSAVPAGVAIGVLWLLDVYYPLTAISRPRGQVLYLLSIMLWQGGFAVGWCYTTPIAVFWISRGSRFWEWPMMIRLSWALAGCMFAQIIILTVSCVLVILTTAQHLQAGHRDVLDHPLCRYDPHAPRPLRMLGLNRGLLVSPQQHDATSRALESSVAPPPPISSFGAQTSTDDYVSTIDTGDDSSTTFKPPYQPPYSIARKTSDLVK